MKACSLSARSLVLLCLFALQLQLFASSAIACKHAGAADEGIAQACAMHPGSSAPPGADDTDVMLDCQKCVLALVFGACYQITSASQVGLSIIPSIDVGNDLGHFYDFVLDAPDRPPISLQG